MLRLEVYDIESQEGFSKYASVGRSKGRPSFAKFWEPGAVFFYETMRTACKYKFIKGIFKYMSTTFIRRRISNKMRHLAEGWI